MKILHVLPEMDLGGVERHVIDLASELHSRGHGAMVVSAGGRMESQLNENIQTVHMPVHLKNPFTAYICALRIAHIVKNGKCDIIHAHSRVPAWCAMWASRMSGVPYVVTAHVDFGNKSHWLYKPYRTAPRVICVSEAVRMAMKDCFYENTLVIVNGVKKPVLHWDSSLRSARKLLFAGRLSDVKGLQDILRVLPADQPWSLDVVGDGAQREEWRQICAERGIADRVAFHGYSDQVERFMANSSCLLFPSYTEGMPLTLAQAVLVGIPVLASDIAPVAELKGDRDGLIAPGDTEAWKRAVNRYLSSGEALFFSPDRVPTLERMVDQTTEVYRFCLNCS